MEGSFFALLTALTHSNGSFVQGVFYFLITKYLPPWPLEQAIYQTLVGLTIATAKWWLFTPRY